MGNRDFLFTYAPHADDRKLFLQPLETGQTCFDSVLVKLRELTDYFVASAEHETTNMHWHFSGRLKEEHSSHGKDWLPRILRPMFPKVKSTTKATDCRWSDNIMRSMAYCQKEHSDNIIYHNITDEQKKEMDTINASVPERDLVTYNFYKSQVKFCCEVMRIAEEDQAFCSQVARKLWDYGRNSIRSERIVFELTQIMGKHNIIYTGSWPNVITTLLQQYAFRGWINERGY